MKVLIVDDSKAMRMIVKRTLRQAGFGGHDMVEAANGKEALDVIKTAGPDLVLSDWNMPEMNGIDLLRALRRAGSKIRFGFITSEGLCPDKRLEAKAEGALFLIAKPFTADSVRSALGPVLQ